MKTYAKNTVWNGLRAIKISNEIYQAVILPDNGAQVISLKHIPSDIEILRTPSDINEMMEMPEAFGIPILFFPNRIADGKFTFNSRQYSFPITKESENNHIHGFLYKRAWEIKTLNATENIAEAILEYNNLPINDLYEMFPHEFTFRVAYDLTPNGLTQNITVTNNSNSPMPFGLGFHTAFNVPFGSNNDPSTYRLKVPVSNLWLRDERNLPTGKTVPLSASQQAILEGNCNPVTEVISGYFTANAQAENIASIIDSRTGTSIVYEADRAYGFWVLWNYNGNSGFVCPEPQTMMTNAPNLNLPDEQTGFRAIGAGKNWQATCRIYLKENK